METERRFDAREKSRVSPNLCSVGLFFGSHAQICGFRAGEALSSENKLCTQSVVLRVFQHSKQNFLVVTR